MFGEGAVSCAAGLKRSLDLLVLLAGVEVAFMLGFVLPLILAGVETFCRFFNGKACPKTT